MVDAPHTPSVHTRQPQRHVTDTIRQRASFLMCAHLCTPDAMPIRRANRISYHNNRDE